MESIPNVKQNITREMSDRIFNAITQATESKSRQQRIVNRKYILGQIIEMYCTWHKDFDCLPTIIQVGAYNPKYLRIIECDVYGTPVWELKKK